MGNPNPTKGGTRVPRFTTKLFNDLAIWMIGLGLLIGISFPFFAFGLGIAAKEVFTLTFWAATLTAGLIAGLVNYTLAMFVVRPRLQLLAKHMHIIEKTVREATFTEDWSDCTADTCRIPVDSHDEIGESAKAFNDLVEALFRARNLEIAVNDFAKTLSSQLELNSLSKQALDLLLQHTKASAGVILVEASGNLIIVAHHGIRQPQILLESDHVRRAMRTGQCQLVEFPIGIQIEAIIVDFQPREILVIPVEFKNTPLGALVLATNKTFTHDERRLLQLFRRSFGLALNNALVHEHLQRMAAIDTLTNAYNRRFGLIRFREEFNRAVRTNTSLGIMMMDIDYFKSINDTYGHLVGDRVLGKVVESTRRALREGDFVVRYGGEEFLIILPGASSANCLQIGEQVRRLISETVVRDGEQLIRFTASLGIIAFPEFNVDHELDLIKHADEALYTAKRQGRNQVVMAR
jgi:diguanylate cyclase (GGDEF)-like protein